MQDALESSREVVSCRHNGVVPRQLVILNPASLHDREQHRHARENAFAIALDEVRSGSTDSNYQIGSFPSVEAMEIVDEGPI